MWLTRIETGRGNWPDLADGAQLTDIGVSQSSLRVERIRAWARV
jgi:hypothetical protein